jgi:hypothetical protein
VVTTFSKFSTKKLKICPGVLRKTHSMTAALIMVETTLRSPKNNSLSLPKEIMNTEMGNPLER